MIVYVLIARGTTVLAEYGTSAQDFTEKIVAVFNRSQGSGTRLVQIGQNLCAVMTKTINKEDINFAAVIESNDERDNSFNFLDTLSVFYEKELKNPKMTTEMNAFLSKNIKQQMVQIVNKGKSECKAWNKR